MGISPNKTQGSSDCEAMIINQFAPENKGATAPAAATIGNGGYTGYVTPSWSYNYERHGFSSSEYGSSPAVQGFVARFNEHQKNVESGQATGIFDPFAPTVTHQ